MQIQNERPDPRRHPYVGRKFALLRCLRLFGEEHIPGRTAEWLSKAPKHGFDLRPPVQGIGNISRYHSKTPKLSHNYDGWSFEMLHPRSPKIQIIARTIGGYRRSSAQVPLQSNPHFHCFFCYTFGSLRSTELIYQ